MNKDRTGSKLFGSLSAALLLALIILPAAPGAVAGPAGDWAAWYERAQQRQVGATPLVVPPDGTVTGLVFRGQDRFTMSIPDPLERDQFAFRSGTAPRETLVLPFTALTLHSVEDPGAWLPTPIKCTMLEASSELKASHQRWFRCARRDVDARVAGRYRRHETTRECSTW